jgi:hypothetical protein
MTQLFSFRVDEDAYRELISFMGKHGQLENKSRFEAAVINSIHQYAVNHAKQGNKRFYHVERLSEGIRYVLRSTKQKIGEKYRREEDSAGRLIRTHREEVYGHRSKRGKPRNYAEDALVAFLAVSWTWFTDKTVSYGRGEYNSLAVEEDARPTDFELFVGLVFASLSAPRSTRDLVRKHCDQVAILSKDT